MISWFFRIRKYPVKSKLLSSHEMHDHQYDDGLLLQNRYIPLLVLISLLRWHSEIYTLPLFSSRTRKNVPMHIITSNSCTQKQNVFCQSLNNSSDYSLHTSIVGVSFSLHQLCVLWCEAKMVYLDCLSCGCLWCTCRSSILLQASVWCYQHISSFCVMWPTHLVWPMCPSQLSTKG